MSFKTILNTLLSEIREKAIKHYRDRLVSLVVFGSVAKGKATPTSDVDLLIVLEDKPESSFKTYMDFYENVESKLNIIEDISIRISPIFLKKTSLKEEIPWLWDTEFIVLYDKNGFFDRFLKRLERFKKRIKFIEKPMPHFVIKDGE